MKIFAFTMAVIILMLSFMPCMDDDACLTGEKNAPELSSTGHTPCTDHPDACSPFCTCNCCAGFSINHAVAAVPAAGSRKVPAYGVFYSARINGVSLSIWQPPQLV